MHGGLLQQKKRPYEVPLPLVIPPSRKEVAALGGESPQPLTVHPLWISNWAGIGISLRK